MIYYRKSLSTVLTGAAALLWISWLGYIIYRDRAQTRAAFHQHLERYSKAFRPQLIAEEFTEKSDA